jgi:hypothetical protein
MNSKQNAIRSLVSALIRTPSADNSQPWHFYWDGEWLQVQYDESRVKGITFPPFNPATLLSVGAMIETLTQVATTTSLPFEFQILPDMPGTAPIFFRVRLNPDEIAEKLPSPFRHTNRLPYQARLIPEDVRSAVAAFHEGSSRVRVILDRPLIFGIA